LICALFLIVATPIFAQIPRTLSYQGILTDTSGTPLPNASYAMVFRLYPSSSGGSAVWSENKAVQVKGGLFSTSLGDVTPFPGSVRFTTQYWLGVQVGVGAELTPRTALTATPYALSSESADSARIAIGVGPGAVTTSGLADNAVTSAKIQNGSILFSDMAQNGAASGQVMKWNGSSWGVGNDSVGSAASSGPWQLNGSSVYYSGGNIGIGTNTPGFPLSFLSNSGDKISLWGQSGAHYGFGIQGGQLQIHTDIAASDILFGYGTSAAFTERMRIKGNGYVGIGISTPNAPLTFAPALGKKITLYPGATGDVGFGVAGNRLQIYSDNPNADVAIGYDAGGTFNERFAVKPTGAVAVNGNVGGAGQVLMSTGGASAATWSNRPVLLTWNQSADVAITGSQTEATIPGLDGQQFIITQTSRIAFATTLHLGTNVFGSPRTITYVEIKNASNVRVGFADCYFQFHDYPEQSVSAHGATVTLAPGTYTIFVSTRRTSTIDGELNAWTAGSCACQGGQMIMQIFPE
jgi:hypothetical protein